MGHVANWLKVKLRPRKPHAPVFEVRLGNGGWFYHQVAGGNITNVSEAYSKKGNAKRAAYAQAVRIDGAVVKVIGPDEEVE